MKNSKKLEADLVISGGKIVTEEGIKEGQLLVKDGRIEGILPPEEEISAGEKVDAAGCVVMPGVIDPHVHFCKPGPNSYKDDYLIETAAAAAGGMTTVVEMPLSVPPVIDKKSFNLKLDTHINKSLVDFIFWGALIPYSINNVEELWGLGCAGFKGFMAPHDKYQNLKNYHVLKAMEKIASVDGLLAIHAEDEDLINNFTRIAREKPLNEGNPGSIYADSRPPITELEAIRRVILFTGHTGARVHIVHLSIAEGAGAVKEAKESGIDITVETCPHYLILNRDHLEKEGLYAKCEPPLRDAENVEKMWDYILDGTIDYVASDHSSFTEEQRLEGRGNIWDAPPGLAGLETLLPLMIDEGVHKRGLSLERLVQLTSTNAARRLRIYPRKGTFNIGADADITIVDLNKKWTYSGRDSLSKTRSTYNPYEGREIKGRVLTTIVRGNIIYNNGKLTGKAGSGDYVYRD